MVGGLVEDEEIAAGEQQAGEVELATLAAGEPLDGGEQLVLGEPDAAGDALRHGLELVAALVGEALLELSIGVDGGIQLITRGLRHHRGEVLQLVLHGAQRARLQQVVDGQLALGGAQGGGLLLQVDGAVGDAHRAGGQRAVAGDGMQQGGLAHPVGPDERHLLALLDEQGDIIEKDPGADLDACGRQREHGDSCEQSRSSGRAGPLTGVTWTPRWPPQDTQGTPDRNLAGGNGVSGRCGPRLPFVAP